ISIAALFPAGIAQQRQSVDDITGPIVAQNALAILRTKLRPADFGTFEEFGGAVPPLFTIDGDWPWLRPAFILDDPAFSSGTIDIFNGTGAASADEFSAGGSSIASGIPFSTTVFGTTPVFIITQQERYYPMRSINSGDPRPPRPQYVWDCMFRRFQGKVLVAIFVYRTTIVGGGDVAYSVPVNPTDPGVPPMPISLDITTSEMWADEGPWDADGDQFIWGTRAGEPYDTTDQRQSWQEPGQWILDQNNNMHRVLSRVREDLNDDGDPSNDPVQAELVRPVPTMPVLPVYFLLNTGIQGVDDVVSNIWYIPREVELDTNQDGQPDLPVRLTPVYVTVREL
ncbi:MAG: hypothetical protein V3T53_03645, partial [Phycisphaerales bacterium]